jgi:hypothetical protein
METTASPMMLNPTPLPEHRWLQRLVGTWTAEQTNQPMLDLWIVVEGQGEMPEGGPAATLVTLGFDPQRGHFVGIFAGSMMNYLWHYQGSLDESERILTLECEGPDMQVPGRISQYRDIYEWLSDDLRVFRSQVLDENGQWVEFMATRYRRTA